MKTPWFVVEALRQFGTDMLSGLPLYRVVWSAAETVVRYGAVVPRYDPDKPRWILERHCPPSFYGSREAWERTRDFESGEYPLGDYPSRGGYEPSFIFEQAGEFIPLSADFVVLLCRAIERGRLGTQSDTLLALRRAAEKAKADEIKRLADWAGEFAVPHGTAAVSGTPGGGEAAKIEFMPQGAMPRFLRRAGGGFAQLELGEGEKAALASRKE